MTKTDIHLRDEEISSVLPQFGVGPLLFTRPSGGTANASVIIVARGGQYVLKRRNPRYCNPQQLTYDHYVLHAVRRKGLPVPQPVKTPSGSRWLEHEGHIYELYHFIEGKAEPDPSMGQVAASGSVLARFHQTTEGLQPRGSKSLGRFWDPKKAMVMLGGLLERARAGDTGSLEEMDAAEAASVLEYLLAQVAAVEERLPDEAYRDLPQTIIHGDWHPANLKFEGEKVAGIFDFDWVDLQPRMVDIADGMLYVCGVRPPVEGLGDIWSLTVTPQLKLPRMKAFMAAYAGVQPLTEAEVAALADLMAVRWVYSRVDAAERKVAKADQIRFVLREVAVPLEWLAEHREVLAQDGWWS